MKFQKRLLVHKFCFNYPAKFIFGLLLNVEYPIIIQSVAILELMRKRNNIIGVSKNELHFEDFIISVFDYIRGIIT